MKKTQLNELWTLLSIFQSEQNDKILNTQLTPIYDTLQNAINNTNE